MQAYRCWEWPSSQPQSSIENKNMTELKSSLYTKYRSETSVYNVCTLRPCDIVIHYVLHLVKHTKWFRIGRHKVKGKFFEFVIWKT
jgi:hypothetical protein